ncbi:MULTISPECIES: alkaline phosphatase [unclassified Roseateles]|uniref:Alkaline phosphatase n=1 Tax=Roseateles hydrophilus TaxID=2975054 RepID=A0ACC6CFI9_9BURK|nr:alkaline phosphatase [Pelomonas sp. UHG3]MCY4747050.1 alkaline phosphatase [Pelomonas sp. UHG3]
MKSFLVLAALAAGAATAAPTVTRLTPPSELFTSGRPEPVIARFLPGQRFDLQATVRPDAGQKITAARFLIDGKPVAAGVALRDCTSGCTKEQPKDAAIVTARALSVAAAGRHEFSIEATQADGQKVMAKGNFDIVPFTAAMGPKVKNIIILLGDGMGASQRTAARLVHGYAQGKALQPLAMDTFSATALVKTASLNSIVTDSSPGMTAYVSGNKNNNNEEGVFPDDTLDAFDNPRIEYLSEYLHRTQGKQLGIVTTADVFDATPAGNAVHTSNRGAGTGIVDQFLDDRAHTGLTVLMGGGRKWFLPAGTPGSARTDSNDYAFSATDAHTADIVKRWGAAPGSLDKGRDLIADFQRAGFGYAATKADLDRADLSKPLLGLFAFSNMNVALDKINGRRGTDKNGLGGGSVVDDFGLPDQPMLDEMAVKALQVLKQSPKGFVLMIEGASIDKQAHAMDTERWMLDTLEFDRAVRVAQDFAAEHGDTLVIVTADHECSGAALIGGSMVTDQALQALAAKKGVANLRNAVVGRYESAGFPRYKLAADGYPETTDIDYRLLVGYGANADRYEDWRTKRTPQRDSQQPLGNQPPLKWYPANALERDDAVGEYLVTGQVPGESAVHTATDIPLSAYGPGALAFTGVIDNTDVFFKLAQAAVKGVVAPADSSGAKRPPKPKR